MRMMRTLLLILTTLFSWPLFAAGHDLTTSPRPSYPVAGPVVTGNGSGFTAAWIEPIRNQDRVVAQTVAASGEPIDGARNTIDQGFVEMMAIAHSASDTLVAWAAGGNVFAERLSPSGIPLNLFLLTPGQDRRLSGLAVAWDGSRYFVVWANQSQLLGLFISPDGSWTSPRPFFTEPSQPVPRHFAPGVPEVAWNGQHFVVVFGEIPDDPCYTLCPSPTATQFRVMRVSAGGDAVDSSPPFVGSRPIRAHLASSGAESLIVCDNFRTDGSSDVSTTIVRDEGSLKLDRETTLFHWYSDVASAVAWDGSKYIVGWRYEFVTAWMATANVTRSGLPFDYRVTTTRRSLPSGAGVPWGPSIAVNDAGVAAFVISERDPSQVRLYLASEFAPLPAPPAAPRNIVSFFGSTKAVRIDWEDVETPAGFLLEWSSFPGAGEYWFRYAILPGDARTFTTSAFIGNQFRIRAFGPGGVSEAPITRVVMPRQHAQRTR